MGLFSRIATWARSKDQASYQSQRDDFANVVQNEFEKVKSRGPLPTQSELGSLMTQVRAVRVYEDGYHQDSLLGNKLLVEVDAPTEIESLAAALTINDGPGFTCRCFGGPTLELLAADQSQLALIAIHHGASIRWSRWKDYADLIDGRRLLEWLAQRGVIEPLRAFEAGEG